MDFVMVSPNNDSLMIAELLARVFVLLCDLHAYSPQFPFI